MELNIQDFVEKQLNEVINESEGKLCNQYMSVFKKYQQKAVLEGNSQQAFYYEILWNASALEFSDNKMEPLRFVSFNGYTIHTLDIFSETNLKIIAELVKFTDEPELLARLGDILWLKGVKKETYQIARKVVKAYLEACHNLGTSDYIIRRLERWQRGVQIARQLKDMEQLQEYGNYLKSLFSFHKNDVARYDLFHILTLFLEYGIDLDRSEEFIERLHKIAINAKQNHHWELAECYLELEAKWHQSKDNLEEVKQCIVLIAEIYEEKAKFETQHNPPNYIGAHASIERAIVVLRKVAGTRDLIDKLHLLMDEYGRLSDSQMQPHSFPAELPEAEMKRAIEDVSGKTLAEALYSWADLIPLATMDELRDWATENIKESNFRIFYRSVAINDLGKVVSRQDNNNLGSEHTLKEEMLRVVALWQQMCVATYLLPALYQINLEHVLDENEILLLFKKSPLIASGHEQIYVKGLIAGLQENGFLAAHLLIPQIENSLREALAIYGKITSSLSDELVQEEYTLNKIIYKEELEKIFGEATMFNLQALLVEKHGLNLRNLMSHGLMKYESFFSLRMTYLTWLALRLLYTPYHKMVSQEDDEPQ